MFFPFRRRRTLKERIKYGLESVHGRLIKNIKKLRNVSYSAISAGNRLKKMGRSARYFAVDTGHEMKKVSRHLESVLFSLIIVLGLIMLLGSGNANLLNSLIALLIIVLVAVIYIQLRFQKSMLGQYVPAIDYVRIRKCQLYSDRIRTVNLYGAKEKLGQIKKIRNVKIGYDIVNNSFSPVSIQAAALEIKLKKEKRTRPLSAISILDVEPKRSSGAEVTFRLKRELDFGSIEWLGFEMIGNCRKKVRIEPHLYVNILLRGRKPDFIFEPFSKFRKREEIKSG